MRRDVAGAPNGFIRRDAQAKNALVLKQISEGIHTSPKAPNFRKTEGIKQR